MRCGGFLCYGSSSKVIRRKDRNAFIRRIRQCKRCGNRFATIEKKDVDRPYRAPKEKLSKKDLDLKMKRNRRYEEELERIQNKKGIFG